MATQTRWLSCWLPFEVRFEEPSPAKSSSPGHFWEARAVGGSWHWHVEEWMSVREAFLQVTCSQPALLFRHAQALLLQSWFSLKILPVIPASEVTVMLADAQKWKPRLKFLGNAFWEKKWFKKKHVTQLTAQVNWTDCTKYLGKQRREVA